jgi:hypothetical protein
MSAPLDHQPVQGYATFARYAFPPNELGYCGPADASVLLRGDDPTGVVAHAREFDGAWAYLQALAEEAGVGDPLDDEVVRNYWVGGDLLQRVNAADLLGRLRHAFSGQVTGLLSELSTPAGVLANHSFHVFVVYPWVRFLGGDPTTPVKVMQDCRIRWGTVDSVDESHAVVVSAPLVFDGDLLRLGEPAPETVRWSKDGTSLTPAPQIGDFVSAHWDWVCDTLSADERDALADATQTTLDLVNAARA